MRDVKEPEVRRREIMDAAARLFISKGYLDTTTQDIIKEAGISRGLLYYHFRNKKDILFCIIEKYSQPLIFRLEQTAFDTEKTAIEKVRQFLALTIISEQDAGQMNSGLQEAVNLEENRYMLDRFYHSLADKMTGYFAHIIEQGNREGAFHVLYPMETAAFLMTGYAFVSNDAKITCRDKEELETYIAAYKEILANVLASDQPLFEK